jgi:hypothetical protein
MTTTPRGRALARNYLKQHGRAAFRNMLLLLHELHEQEQEFNEMLGVSRAFVREWRETFGDCPTPTKSGEG